jgi:hypothetical protein
MASNRWSRIPLKSRQGLTSVEARHSPALILPKGVQLLAGRARDSTNAPPTSCEPSNCLSRDGARRCADGVSPSGVSTVDDRRRLAVRAVSDHASPRPTEAIGCRARVLADGVVYPVCIDGSESLVLSWNASLSKRSMR